ncbi:MULTISPECIES: DUF86 domain-containing protein [Virgibacillus]|uniref:DUF86 domain-containing protein n=2 Tax=Virgibacillus TaxID=84406 RepID=A0A024Q9N5_9BACI|nr:MULTISPECIES: DUF86 domain-containing protein [Virgibacillus]EQB37297.1 hypothetical protein M948_01810 [Virgibacillus sp. CM-4]MYL40053.1 DUF86 domain-containing protein [Virgibacillus massiliensis]GGJ62544.1 hypothetical protein GCM10007111_25800 [Virgibacillus kapii]CDQ39204.1 hypothetical protein BN990_01490 [Virgibacillus massiliensis]
MYFVERSKIEQTLEYLDQLLDVLKMNDPDTLIDKLGLERAVHIVIECTIDVGNMMIDGFIMRDPGSYDDIIDILIDEKVLPLQEETPYKQLIQLRKMLMSSYHAVDHRQLQQIVQRNYHIYKQFSSHVRTYLDNELGVANAFSNES